ncbi:peptidase M3A and M3B thimet/oligopeptidase F [Bacillus sp. HMF5848]|uniref:M2 family metallopeptidase n=1 Tax=Bacillus sp. HMF5848 TaxID=2495421 RepID=UPI000F7AB748|nr:M2 family metallopeptidase [Bacillus sp. HMF5848]RSK25900.1 peptidase M3A and M3B thimet/oligopeptidase F [Bacillus sp. HMF5848]
MSVNKFLLEQNEIIRELHISRAESSWMASTTGDAEWNQKTAKAQTDLNLYYANKERFQQVEQFLAQDIDNPLHKRQLEILHASMVKNQLPEEDLKEMIDISTELIGVFNTFRATLDGEQVSENDIRQILIKSNNLELRERAWHASKQIGHEVEEKLLTLIRKRNETARALGYEDYHQMSFESQELDREYVFNTFNELKELSDEPFRQLKLEMDEELAARFQVAVEDLRPWHYADPFFQEAPPSKDLDLDPFYEGKSLEDLTVSTFKSMGMDITDMIEKSDLYPRDKKNQHAFCTDINRDGDVRVLCNNVESDYWSVTMLHEFGHAVYFKYIDRELPFILRAPAHTLTTEAIAMLYGRMGKDPNWMQRFLGVSQEQVEALTPQINQSLRRQMLIAARWIMTFAFFERELYKNPDQDLNSLWWSIVEEVQFVNPPENRSYPHWAAKIHFTLVPVYYQNYLLGELTTSQLERYIEKNICNDLFNIKVGDFLVNEFFAPGAKDHWNTKIEKATGEKLNPIHFVEQFVNGK